MLSGALLQAYCPDAGACDRETGVATGELGACDGRKLWGIIGALTCTSPLLILLLQARSHLRIACRLCYPCAHQVPCFLVFTCFLGPFLRDSLHQHYAAQHSATQLVCQTRKYEPGALPCMWSHVQETASCTMFGAYS